MNVNDFVHLAKFPPNWKEEHLQNYIDRRLKQLGYKTETEVWCGENCGRADIVADLPDKPDYPGDLIEVKRWLTREDIFQARGQAESYQKLIKSRTEGKLRNITVIGMAPIDPEEYRKASVAKKLCLQSGIDVIFVNEEEIFYPSGARIFVGVKQEAYAVPKPAHSTKNGTTENQETKEECILNLNYPFGKFYIKYKQNSHYANDIARGISNFLKQISVVAKIIFNLIKYIISLIIRIYCFFKRLTRKRYTKYKKNQLSKYLKIMWLVFGIFYLFIASIEVNSKFRNNQRPQITRTKNV